MKLSEIEAELEKHKDDPEPICRCGHHQDWHDLDSDFYTRTANGYHALAPCSKCQCRCYRFGPSLRVIK
jgi:hypothetical protein